MIILKPWFWTYEAKILRLTTQKNETKTKVKTKQEKNKETNNFEAKQNTELHL